MGSHLKQLVESGELNAVIDRSIDWNSEDGSPPPHGFLAFGKFGTGVNQAHRSGDGSTS
jgi:hypothetical protein